MLTPSLGKQASGEGAGGRLPSTPRLSHQLQPAFQPGWELVPVPKKAPVGGRGSPAAGRGPLSEPAPPWPSLCLLLLPKLPRTSSRLSSSARTFSPSWAGTLEAPRRPRGQRRADVRLREDTGEIRIWRSQAAPPGQQPLLPGLRDTCADMGLASLKCMCMCVCGCGCVCADVCVHMGMGVGASAEKKTGGRERPRSGGASLEGRRVGSPTSTPAQRASFMQGPRYRACRGCCPGESRDRWHPGHCGPRALPPRGPPGGLA